MVTTRSDSFKVYVLVQGWRNVNTDNPERVFERRGAYIGDRSGVTPTNAELLVPTRVPVN